MALLLPDELRPGLWRWTAPHPEWQPESEPGTPASWPEDVGCALYESAGHAVFFDPLAPPADAAFWRWADQRCRGRAVVLLQTIHFHSRSREEFVARYDATTVAPAAVVGYPIARAQETVYWLPEHRALIPGDSLIATDGGRLSVCPASWLEYLDSKPTRAEVAQALAGALGSLDVELVLVSHGDPVTSDARGALARALARA